MILLIQQILTPVLAIGIFFLFFTVAIWWQLSGKRSWSARVTTAASAGGRLLIRSNQVNGTTVVGKQHNRVITGGGTQQK